MLAFSKNPIEGCNKEQSLHDASVSLLTDEASCPAKPSMFGPPLRKMLITTSHLANLAIQVMLHDDQSMRKECTQLEGFPQVAHNIHTPYHDDAYISVSREFA